MPELAVLLRVVHTITAATTDYRQLLEVIARETGAALGGSCSIRLGPDQGGEPELAAASDPDPDALERAAVDLVRVPLAVHGETIGLLVVARHGAGAQPFSARERDLARAIADHAALSISNARLYDAAQRELATRRRVETTFRISEEARLLAQGVVDTVQDPLLVLDGNLVVQSGNHSYYETFRSEPGEVEGRRLGELGAGEWDVPALAAQLELTARDGTPIEGFELEREFAGIGDRVMVVSARRILGAGRAGRLLLAISDVTRRVQAERALIDYARRLEERTRELESANHELDSFSYSVSHDLRAPLRAIDGFSRILGEEHGGSLDPEGLRLLAVVRSNIRKMAQLIDDLLAFSRLGRKPLAVAEVDMEALVRQIAAEAVRAEPERRVELRIGPVPAATADRTLIEQVWVNLISNAVKYTRGRDDAIIAIDGLVEVDQIVYRIADNGVGFDMRYANKLFGVFQRLHAASEFEGTGVGLALVRRIVNRHGGWISADGRPGAGATFEFALPRRDRW
jgi:signal transduction histidine kinase